MDVPVTRSTHRNPVGNILTEVRIILPRLDVVRLQLAFLRLADLASAVVSVDHLPCPCLVLARPALRAGIASPLVVGWTRVTEPAFIGARLAAEFLFAECRDRLTWPDRKNLAAVQACFLAVTALPARMCSPGPVLGAPTTSAAVRAELERLGSRRDDVLFYSTFLAGDDQLEPSVSRLKAQRFRRNIIDNVREILTNSPRTVVAVEEITGLCHLVDPF
jgi:hypothetical protein